MSSIILGLKRSSGSTSSEVLEAIRNTLSAKSDETKVELLSTSRALPRLLSVSISAGLSLKEIFDAVSQLSCVADVKPQPHVREAVRATLVPH